MGGLEAWNMEIETKHLFAFILLIGAGSLGMFLTLISQRLRDVALFVLVFGSVLVDKLNITLMGTFWYRGTSRGIEISALDLAPLCLLIATVLVPRYPRGRFYWPASLGMMIVYFLYCVVSVWTAEPQLHGVWELTKVFRGVLVFLAAALFVRGPREIKVVVFALCCTASMETANALEQRYFKGAIRAPGTMDHANTLSTYFCMVAPVLVAAAMSNWSKWLRWFAGLSWIMAAGGVLLTLSRLGVPVFAFVSVCTALACTSWRLTLQKAAIVAAACIGVGAFLVISWDGLKSRYANSNVRAEFTDESGFETRGMYWRIAFAMIQDHPYGVGLNNWSYYVAKTYGPDMGFPYRDYDEIRWVPTKQEAARTLLPPAADSLPALTLGELGKAGLAVFLLVWLRWLQMGAVFLGKRLNDDPMHRMAIGCLFGTVGIFMQSVTEWTYRQTPVLFTFHVLTGMLASLYYARRQELKAAKKAEAEELEDEEEIEIEVTPLPATPPNP